VFDACILRRGDWLSRFLTWDSSRFWTLVGGEKLITINPCFESQADVKLVHHMHLVTLTTFDWHIYQPATFYMKCSNILQFKWLIWVVTWVIIFWNRMLDFSCITTCKAHENNMLNRNSSSCFTSFFCGGMCYDMRRDILCSAGRSFQPLRGSHEGPLQKGS
jgi:hypothetical protein